MALSKEQFIELRKRGLSVEQIVKFDKGAMPQPQKTVIEQKPEYKGFGASIANFGKDIAQGAYLMFGGQKQIDKVTQQYLSNGDKMFQLAQKQSDPNKKRQYLLQANQMYSDAEGVGDGVLGKVRTNKQIIADALGTLGSATLGATPGGGMAGRLGFGTAVGAGAGTQTALKENLSGGDIAKAAVVGGAVGLATGLAAEGIGAVVKKIAQTKLVQKPAGNIYNRELQPNTKDLTQALERHTKTLGQKVLNETDELGKPVYKGSYATMQRQAENQIKKNASILKGQLKGIGTTTKSGEFEGKLLEKLTEEFGLLDDRQLAVIKAELKRLPPNMSPVELLEQRQITDSLIPKGFWADPNPQRAFVGNVRYYLRGLMKESIEKVAPTTPVRELNQKIGLAMDVKDLSILQEALRAKGKGVGTLAGFWKPVILLLDRTIFSPSVTTRVAQGASRAGQFQGPLAPRGLGTVLGTQKTIGNLQK